MARGIESFGHNDSRSTVEQIAEQMVDKDSTLLRSILCRKTSSDEKMVDEMYPTLEIIAGRVSYAKKAFSNARKVAVEADLKMPKETSMAQTYAELGLLTSIGAGEAVAALVKKEQN